ncbi:putative acetyl-CoA synthetase [Xylogone sp. PMI_703]|nr:putative acetyl-CoA synthetase [Xylogone sp. PMI_703]
MSAHDPEALVPLYRPPKDCSHFEIEKFREFVSRKIGRHIASYDELHQFSVTDQNTFWMLLWKYLDIKASVHPSRAISPDARVDEIPTFYPGARLNFAENALQWASNQKAVISFSERSFNHASILTWGQLRDQVAKVASSLKASGTKMGDVVAFLGSNSSSALIVFLATASIGAIFCSLAGDMGEKAVLDRLTQIQPAIIFADNAYQYNGKLYDCVDRMSKIGRVLRQDYGLKHSVWVENIDASQMKHSLEVDDWITLPAFLALKRNYKTDFSYQQVAFEHPMIIVFSSGTTGKPKGMVHSHGGPLINLKKEHVLHENMSQKDIYYHYSNIGWTMWNIFLGGLLAGATLVLYDGSPFYPSVTDHLNYIVSLGTTVFGGSPRYFTELKTRGFTSNQLRAKSKLRLLGSTGAVLPASIWSWMASEFGNIPIISFSGGTEVCGSFVHGTIIHPQYAGEITVKALGVDVDIFDANGQSCQLGTPGDLVIKRPFPNAAVRFWDDENFERYKTSYFAQFPGVWTQGDFAKISPQTKGIVMLGRSDGVLNPSGVRFGSAEIYKIMDSFVDQVEDSLCVGQRLANMDEQVLLFVKMRPGYRLDASLIERIRNSISQALSTRHVPKHMLQVDKIPYNVNGKKLEVLVKRVLSGDPIDAKIKSTLVHPDDLEPFKQYIALGKEITKAKL